MRKEWVTGIRQQCKAAKVPFFFKQWGGVRKSESGRELEGRTYDEMPKRKPCGIPTHKIRLGMIDEARKWEAAYDLPEMTTDVTGGVECQPLLFQP